MYEFLIIIVLILLNGLLAMSEIALISVRKSYLLNQARNGSRAAKVALRLVEEPDKFLSTIQIGITVIGILTGLYSGSVLADDFSALLTRMGVPASVSHPIAQTIVVVVVTYLTLIFGELLPKRIGMSVAESVVGLVARPMHLLSRIASPFVWLLARSISFVFNLTGLKSNDDQVTEQEIKLMVEQGTRGGQVQQVEQDIVERVFLLGDLRVSSIMTHRSEVIALDINMSSTQIKEILRQNIFDMYPVVNRNFDNIQGVVTLRNLMFEIDNPDFCLSSILSPAVYFHENMSVYKVLEQMKEQRISQALICDEFGSCQGIITLKDILEGLVGTLENISDEPDIIKRSGNSGWLVDGQCAMHDFLSYFEKEEFQPTENQYNTIGGLLLQQLEHIPHTGECLTWNGFKFEVVDMDGARIDKILVTLS